MKDFTIKVRFELEYEMCADGQAEAREQAWIDARKFDYEEGLAMIEPLSIEVIKHD